MFVGMINKIAIDIARAITPPSLLGIDRKIGTTALPLDRFSLNFIFDYFSKICLENPSYIKVGQE